MFSLTRSAATFAALGASAIAPLSFLAGEPFRKEEHVWDSSKECILGYWDGNKTLLECNKDLKAGKKINHKFFLLKDYSKVTFKWNPRNIKNYKFNLVGKQGLLMFLSENSPNPLNLLYLEPMKNNNSAGSSVNIESFMQKHRVNLPKELEKVIKEMNGEKEKIE